MGASIRRGGMGSAVLTTVSLTATLTRTVTDLTFFSPVSTSLFYTVQGLFEGRSFHTSQAAADEEPLEGIYERLEERLIPTWQKQARLPCLFTPPKQI